MNPEVNDEDLIATINSHLKKAIKSIDKNQIVDAENYSKLLEEISNEFNSKAARARSLFINACIIHKKNEYAAALNQFLAITRINENYPDKKFKAMLFNHISICYDSLCDFEEALNFALKALAEDKENPALLKDVGTSYSRVNDNDKALHFFRKALIACPLQDEIGEEKKFDTAATYLCIANILYDRKEYDQANEMFDKILPIARKTKNLKLESQLLFGMALTAHELNDTEKAIQYLKEALALSEKIKDRIPIMRMTYQLSVFHKKIKDFETALQYLEDYTDLLEITFNDQTSAQIAELQSKLDQERKEKEEKERQLQEVKRESEYKLLQLRHAYADVIGIGKVGVFSDKMHSVLKLADFFHSDRNVPVLIEGETGTGKEIIARIIHYGKDGFSGPFVVINCSAISPSLFESELFGYEEGAFTGAKQKGMIGKFELAQGGTLFLDEIGELPLDLQPKLLRALQQKEIYRIGGHKEIKLDVRVVCATNRDLKKEMEEKRFRSDLYFRLNTGRLFIPPLRDRQEEIGPLAQMFMLKFAQEKLRKFKYINEDALKVLEKHDWPGNVRELQNAIERVVLLYDGIELEAGHLNFINGGSSQQEVLTGEEKFAVSIPEDGLTLEEMERRYLKYVLDKFEGNKSKAADFLNITRKTFYRKKIE